MRRLFLYVGTLLLAPCALGQNEWAVNNDNLVVAQFGASGIQPSPTTVPPGYYGNEGVAAGTRAWTFTPKLHRQGGANPDGSYINVGGFLQSIFVGPAVTIFPTTTQTYQFRSGIAPAESFLPQLGMDFAHASTGTDIVATGQAALALPSGGPWTLSVTLANPVPLQDTELVLYVEYRGGEQVNDPMGGQAQVADWEGGYGIPGATLFGFTTGPVNGRSVMLSASPRFRGIQSLLVPEPVFTATGYHANRYDSVSVQPQVPLALESYRGVSSAYADWGPDPVAPNSAPSLFFDFRCGPDYALTGAGTVLANIGPSLWDNKTPTPFGNVLLNPIDPLTFAFSGSIFPMDANGNYVAGPNAPFALPRMDQSAVGLIVQFQGIVANIGANLTDIQFLNSSGMLIMR